MLENVVIKIENLDGTASSKERAVLIDEVKAIITPASNEILALYPDFPMGQTFTFTVNADYLDARIKSEAKLTVVNEMNSQFELNDVFVVNGYVQKSKILENVIYSGVCILQD